MGKERRWECDRMERRRKIGREGRNGPRGERNRKVRENERGKCVKGEWRKRMSKQVKEACD